MITCEKTYFNATAFTQTVAPAEALFALAKITNWAKVDGSEDDTLLTALITAATNHCQAYSWRQFVSATYYTLMDNWCNEITIWKNPVSAVSSITYYDKDNVSQTLAASDYSVNYQEPCMIKIKNMPEVYDRLDAIKITFVAGYGAASAVPEEFKTAVEMMITEWNENRQNSSPVEMQPLPFATKAILDLNSCKAFL